MSDIIQFMTDIICVFLTSKCFIAVFFYCILVFLLVKAFLKCFSRARIFSDVVVAHLRLVGKFS